MTTRIVALDGGWADTVEAEHAARETAGELDLPVVTACTHFVTGAGARVVVTLEVPAAAPPVAGDARDSLPWEVAAHAGRTGGRAFVFPGSAELTGVMSIGSLLARSAIDDVAVIGGAAPAAWLVVDTQDFVRPLYTGGRLLLHTRPAAGVDLVPFEQPEQTPCCTDHAPRRVAATSWD
jgi:hypothetical protein